MAKDRIKEGEHLEEFKKKIQVKEIRKVKGRQEKKRGILYGLGMFGMVGWSVAIPTVILAAIGLWIDRTWPGRFSWTLMLLTFGLAIGCLNAWYWVRRESRGD
ncbi:MAG: ATPase F0F1 [wastewater metagenome]|nr:ATPase F0F1 [Candidatus Loosdrechtia aerotolerans]